MTVALISDRTERLDPGSELTGTGGPFRVVTSRPHGTTWLVRFEGVDDRTAAEALRGIVLHAESDDELDGLWVHHLVGRDVVEVDGTPRGRIEAVQANPAHDLLVLDDGTLVPVVFVVSSADHVVVDVPEGLFE